MNGKIMAEGNSIFLCVCDLNNRIRKETCLRINFAVEGEVQFIPPSKEGAKWKAVLRYTCEDISVMLVNPKFEYSFVLTEADNFGPCMENHDKERANVVHKISNVQMFNPQFIMPKHRGAKCYAYSMYYYPSKKKRGT